MFSQAKHATRVAGRAASSAARQLSNIVKEAGNRALSIPTLLADVSSTRSRMKMRLRVVILRDEHDNLLADPTDVRPSIIEAQEIFRRDANIHIEPFDHDFIRLAPSAAPSAALDVSCGVGAYMAEIGIAGEYFRKHRARDRRSRATGYATPLTVFIVRTMTGANGCALGPIADYATVSIRGLRSRSDAYTAGAPRSAPRVVAHELGHMCGLLHSGEYQDLMYRSAGWLFTKRSQILTIRNSRFVTTL